MSDYWIIHRRRLHVPMLYQNDGIYSYSYGVNWRALVALLIAVPMNLPGLIHAINADIDIGNYMYFCETSFKTRGITITTIFNKVADTGNRQSIVVDSNVYFGWYISSSESSFTPI